MNYPGPFMERNKMKSVVVFCVIILSSGQATAAIKDCEELKSEIAAKLVAAGVASFVLDIVDKDRTGPGRILGRCQGGTKRIVRRMSVPTSAPGGRQVDTPPRRSSSFASGIKNCEELKFEIATKLTTAGISPAVLTIVDRNWAGAGKIVGSCEDGTKRIVRTPVVDSAFGIELAYAKRLPVNVASVSLAYGIKDCGELKSEIAAKLVAAGVRSFHLSIVNKDRAGGGKIVGSCENGTKRIIRRK
ncbi:MAG: DUF1161 domain-containing protein [Candidatus Electrothrix communis]|nr:DUF1161 domain-containing protein [Desulfobulbus sp. US4]WLE98516.1 MAG: DUF1161 domain-containing protein [Candidatus Electrothrix communis]